MKNKVICFVWSVVFLIFLPGVSVGQKPFPPDRFPVVVKGTELIINDCSGRRFFLAGMVDNIPNSGLQLSLYDHDEMERQFLYHKAIGATAMRWNAFLRGKDLRWDAKGYVTGICENAAANLKDGCDLAYKHGMVLQIVLSTAHWLQYGSGGETPENVTRVNNNRFMFEDTVATQAYIDNIIKPVTRTIGVHPGLFGYCIINEASGMFYPEDAGLGTWSNVKVHMADFQRWVNRVASEIRTQQPGAILSVSGVAPGLNHFCDSVLIARGGRSNGTLDINQIQFYPTNHGENWSPYLHTPVELFNSFGGDLKPVICGETPIEGIINDGSGKFKGSEEFGLEEAYTRLWNNGYSGGFTWSNRVYERMSPADKAVVDAAYTNFYNNYLVNNDFDGSKCPNHVNAVSVNNNLPVLSGNVKYVHPVNPDASKEAVELLNYFYSIKGKVVIAGQHNVLGKMSEIGDSLKEITGAYPAMWGSDFGFADSTHDIDNIAYRKFFVPEVIKQHKRGAIITLTYHQANPIIGEPCQFHGGIISKLTDDQWKELTTVGTPLYEEWRKQIDRFALYLKELEQLKIPILFRPYHEMNGSWFWWGGRPGEEGFIKLWKQLFNYYTHHHKLTNLIWIWSPDNPKHGLKEFYPGDEFVDMIGCDIYPKKESIVYGRHIYDQIVEIAGEKPIGIGECSILPTPEILEQQPLWAWFLAWGGMIFRNKKEDIINIYKSPKIKTLNVEN